MSEITKVDQRCSICQTPIESGEPMAVCNKCGLPFHEDCWRENLGCSAYGCPNVNMLKAGPDIRIANAAPPPPERSYLNPVSLHSVPPIGDDIPWEFLLLAASVFGTLLDMFCFGLPTIAVAVATALYIGNTRRRPNIAATIACFIICGIGFVVGVSVSLVIHGCP